jgi:membrane fusion protein (multidrug efflux system)
MWPVKSSIRTAAPLPSKRLFRPIPILSQTRLQSVQVQDYAAPSAVTIPVNTLQNDDKGKFVMVAVKEGEKMLARKRQ